MKVEGQERVGVLFEPVDLLNFLKRDFPPMNLVCERAGMFEERIVDRTEAVFKYFGLPFEVDPLARKR
jgi:hypothetical protein